MIYALDTNIIIHYLKPNPNVHQNMNNAIMQGDDLVPIIVDYELRRGFRIQHATRKEAAYEILANQAGCCDIVEIDIQSWYRAEQVYSDLYHKKLTIGELDILIAALCLEKGYTLVTNNTKHFQHIDGLHLVDWTM